MGKMIDITGFKYGKLTVIKNAGKLDGRRYSWYCQCECGKEIIVPGESLRSGNTKSCGCGKYDGLKKYNQINSEQNKILPNTRFGALVVIEDLGLKPAYEGSQKNRRWYKCKCDCGNYCEANGNRLKENDKISCGKCQVSSKGELKIKTILEKNNIIFNREVVIPDLVQKYNHRYRFDFVVYNQDNSINRIIEFDGRQHYEGRDNPNWNMKQEDYLEIQKRDKIKNIFCEENKIKLIRIPYWKLDTLEYNDLMSDKYALKGEMNRD